MQGPLRMLRTSFEEPVCYDLGCGETWLPLNALIGQRLSIQYAGSILCVSCGVATSKSFSGGYCYRCFKTVPECSPCIIKPELCRAHEGVARDMDWAREHHLRPQIVYLAETSGMKVGVTREANLPARWINQGAVRAIRVLTTPNRYLAGIVEVACKAHIADKTNWRRMLTQGNGRTEVDMPALKRELLAQIADALPEHTVESDEVTAITYPLASPPAKVRSVTLDKVAVIEGILAGIKGQYLLFDNGNVFNVRRHQGYVVEFAAA